MTVHSERLLTRKLLTRVGRTFWAMLDNNTELSKGYKNNSLHQLHIFSRCVQVITTVPDAQYSTSNMFSISLNLKWHLRVYKGSKDVSASSEVSDSLLARLAGRLCEKKIKNKINRTVSLAFFKKKDKMFIDKRKHCYKFDNDTFFHPWTAVGLGQGHPVSCPALLGLPLFGSVQVS